MWIFLLILKWIGIVLAAIVGLVILLLALILLVPIRYRATVLYDKKNFRYGVKVTALFSLLRIVKSEDESDFKVKILFFNLFGKKNKKVKSKKVKNKKATNEKLIDSNVAEKESPGSEEAGCSTEQTSDAKATDKDTQNGIKRTKKNRKKDKASKDKKSFTFKKISSIIDFVKNENTKYIWKLAKKELVLLIKHILPKKIKGRCVIGMENPQTTGYIFAGISLLPISYSKGLSVIPDFEKSIIDIDLQIKGRIQVLFLVRMAFRIYRDKQIKLFIKRVKRFS